MIYKVVQTSRSGERDVRYYCEGSEEGRTENADLMSSLFLKHTNRDASHSQGLFPN